MFYQIYFQFHPTKLIVQEPEVMVDPEQGLNTDSNDADHLKSKRILKMFKSKI